MTREELQQQHHLWTARAAQNREQAILNAATGDLVNAEWHRDEAARCEHIASDIRADIQRLSDSPTVGMQANEILRHMLLLEDLDQVRWDQQKGNWTK